MTPQLTWAFRARPLEPGSGSGDLHVVAPFEGGALLAVIDGLGHGSEAAFAAQRAAETMTAAVAAEPSDVVQRCHAALYGTRGAALLVLSLAYREARVSWAGIGNVEGWRLSSGRREALISQAGVVGYQMPRLRSRSAELARGDLFVLASDGISPAFSEILRDPRPPELLAEDVFATYARTTDDALVLVAEYAGEPAEESAP